MACNLCRRRLTTVEPFDARGVPGLRLAGHAYCESCEATTWVLDGTASALRLFQAFLNETNGGPPAAIDTAPR